MEVHFYRDGSKFEYGDFASNITGIVRGEMNAEFRRQVSKWTAEAMVKESAGRTRHRRGGVRLRQRAREWPRRAARQSATALALLRECSRAATVLPSLIASERQALGLTNAELIIEDRRDRPDPIAVAITSDPEAVKAAIALLDRVAALNAAQETTT